MPQPSKGQPKPKSAEPGKRLLGKSSPIQVLEDKPFFGYIGQGFAVGIGTIGAYAAVLLLLGLIPIPSDTTSPANPAKANTPCTSCPQSWVS